MSASTGTVFTLVQVDSGPAQLGQVLGGQAPGAVTVDFFRRRTEKAQIDVTAVGGWLVFRRRSPLLSHL
ncbi:MAG: hypothetical protein JRI22_23775 [Deltaproteobacteria bacterium]|nr:hypothetical protein [Deltaproteobacteria bacterium]